MSAVGKLQTQATQTEQTGIATWPPLLRILTLVTALAVLIGLYLALVHAGTDVTQGHVQRIFYIHVAAFSGAFIAFSATVAGGILYLRTHNVRWDTLALAGVEVGFAMALVNLITGMVWARPIWNTWWTWDPRLTSAAIMCLTYAAYLMLRNGIENPEQRRRFASIFGILAIVTVVVTLVIIRIRPDTIHPTVIVPGQPSEAAEGVFEMTSSMVTALGVNSAIWSILLPITLIWHRIRLQNRVEQVEAMKAEVLNS